MRHILLLLCLPAISALASIIAVYRKSTPALQARRWLLLSMICGALCALLLTHYYHPTLRFSLTLDYLFDAVMLCLAPCFYMCLLSLTSLDGIRGRDYLVFLPGAVLMGIILGLSAIMGGSEAQAALNEGILRVQTATGGHSWAFRAYIFFGHQFYRSFVIIELIAVFYWGAWAIYDYRKRLEDYLVDIPPSMTRGIGLLYVSFVLFALVGMVFAACEYAQTFTYWVIPTLAIGTATSFAMMGYFARQVVYSAEMIKAPYPLPLSPNRFAKGSVTAMSYIEGEDAQNANVNENEDPFRERLAVIEEEKLYRDPNLTIFSLSRHIGTNRTYLTRAFRECYGETFSEHINRLRIEEATRLLTQSPHLTHNEIAAQVGYNSPTSLYRNFVRIHRCSPTEFVKGEKMVERGER